MCGYGAMQTQQAENLRSEMSISVQVRVSALSNKCSYSVMNSTNGFEPFSGGLSPLGSTKGFLSCTLINSVAVGACLQQCGLPSKFFGVLSARLIKHRTLWRVRQKDKSLVPQTRVMGALPIRATN